jgi:hypothetical protein
MHVIAQDERRLALLEEARRSVQLGAPEKYLVRFSNTATKQRMSFVSCRHSNIIGVIASH